MDYNVAKFWLEVLILLSNVILWAWALNNRKHTATNERLETMREQIAAQIAGMDRRIEKRIDSHNAQLIELETHRENAPSHSDMKRLHERIDEFTQAISRLEGNLAGSINGLTGQFKGIERTVDLLHQHLLNKQP